MYHGKTKLWCFPAFYPVHSIVLSDLRKVLPGVTLSTEVKRHIDLLGRPPKLPDNFRYITPPYGHQIEGLLHLYQYLRGGLFYSPGLGKCKITVDLQRVTGDRMLILCPRIMLNTWREEFAKHGNITNVIVVDGYNKKKKLAQISEAAACGPLATIVSYTVATTYTDKIFQIPYSAIIADESHQLKTPFAKRTKAATALATRAYRRVLLSGTPSLGSPFDMYGQLRFLGKYFCSEDWWTFKKMFGVFPVWEQNERVPKILLGYRNLDIMNERVNRVCRRKTKEECLDLPEQQIIDVRFPLYPQQRKTYNDLVVNRCDAAGSTVREDAANNRLNHWSGMYLAPYVLAEEPITLINKLDQINSGFVYPDTRNPCYCDGCSHVKVCSNYDIKPYTSKCSFVRVDSRVHARYAKKSARLDECQGLLETILADEDNKAIVWTRYHAELNQLETYLKEAKIGCVRVQGGMSSENVSKCMTRFNQDKECRVYLGHVATGVGITLNAANYTIYYNIPWNLDYYLQSMDRNYRIGQERKVTVYRLIARNTIDETKAAAIDQKMDFSTLVTSKSVCVMCPDYATRCSQHNIELYDDDCKYDRAMRRETAKIGLIPTP